MTAELLSRSSKDSRLSQAAESHVRRAVDDVITVIGHWSTPESSPTEIGDSLYKIFVRAIQFSELLRKQRACWEVRFPQRQIRPNSTSDYPQYYALMFDPSMKDELGDDEGQDPEWLKKQYVEIVVSPTLFKRGNLDGERFDKEYPAAKALVILRS